MPTGPGKPHMIQKIEKGESWQSSEHLAPGDLLLGIDDVDVTLFSLQDIQAKLGKHQSIVKLTLARNHVRTQVTIRRLDSRQIRFEYLDDHRQWTGILCVERGVISTMLAAHILVCAHARTYAAFFHTHALPQQTG